jgi:hypothetical protein
VSTGTLRDSWPAVPSLPFPRQGCLWARSTVRLCACPWLLAAYAQAGMRKCMEVVNRGYVFRGVGGAIVGRAACGMRRAVHGFPVLLLWTYRTCLHCCDLPATDFALVLIDGAGHKWHEISRADFIHPWSAVAPEYMDTMKVGRLVVLEAAWGLVCQEAHVCTVEAVTLWEKG